MGRMKVIEDAVTAELLCQPDTRGDDDLLYARVVSRLGFTMVYGTPEEFFKTRAERRIPPYESIRRTRQMVQRSREDLRPTEEQLKRRKRQQESLREYYGGR